MTTNEQISLAGREPKYFQVKDSIKHMILSGNIRSGGRVPAESKLCEIYGVSRITVRKALDELQNEGYLFKIQGKGTFVSKEQIEQRLSKFYSFSEEIKKRGMKEYASVLKYSRTAADAHTAKRLQIAEGDLLWRVYRIRFTDEVPYAIETSYIPVSLVPDMTRERISNDGLYRTMASLGVNVDSASEHFMAVNLRGEQAKLLEVREDAAAIRLVRVTYSGQQAVEYCICLVRGDFFNYSVELK